MKGAKSDLILSTNDYIFAQDEEFYFFRHKYHTGAAFKKLIKLSKDAFKATEQGEGYLIDLRR